MKPLHSMTYISMLVKTNLQMITLPGVWEKKSDMWLHTKDVHGAHVVITCEQPDEELLRNAAIEKQIPGCIKSVRLVRMSKMM